MTFSPAAATRRYRSARPKLALAFPLAAAAMLAGIASPVWGQGQLQDFRLPPAPSPTPDVMGPIDEEAPVRRPPAPTPTPRPTATTTPAGPSAPAATAPRQPITLPEEPTARAPAPTASPARTRTPPRADTSAAPTRQRTEAPAAIVGSSAPGSDETAAAEQPVRENTPAAPIAAPPMEQPATAPVLTDAESDEGTAFGWIALIVAILAAVAAFLFLRARRRGNARVGAKAAPLAARPEQPAATPAPRPQAAPSPPARPRGAPASPVKAPVMTPATTKEPLTITVEQIRVTRSIMAITFAWRLQLTNNGDAELSGLQLSGDIACAHGKVPTEQQLASEATALPQLRELPAIGGGETVEVKGEMRLPVDQITPIRQGSAPVLVPLLRLRASGDAFPQRTLNWVVGMQADPAARLQPFPLGDRLQAFGIAGARLLGHA